MEDGDLLYELVSILMKNSFLYTLVVLCDFCGSKFRFGGCCLCLRV
jgi:hypothetical protein